MDDDSRSEALARFQAIYEAAYGPVLAYIRRRTSDQGDAQDALARPSRLRGGVSTTCRNPRPRLPWLYGVAAGAGQPAPGEPPPRYLSTRLRGQPGGGVDVEAEVVASEDREIVRAALSRLRDADQEILRLAVWEELAHRDIATIVGCAEAAVAVRLHRARGCLAREIGKEERQVGQKGAERPGRTKAPSNDQCQRPLGAAPSRQPGADRGGDARATRSDPVPAHHVPQPGAIPYRPPRRRARRLVPALLVASLAGGTVAYALLRGDVTKPQDVLCFEHADTDSATEVVSGDVPGPVGACAEQWRRGVFDTLQVPPLVACVLDSGRVGVFPAAPEQDVCAVLGLPPLAPAPTVSTTVPGPTPTQSPGDVNARILAFREAVSSQFVGAGCVDPQAATAAVRRELERAGLGDWTVRGEGFSPERPCATPSLLPEAREVLLVPSPRR